jgi:prepilin-type N-terminal cleavage/methylation domain-containing protein
MRTSRGFSLVEVIVALMVAGILTLSLIGGQRRQADMVSSILTSWRHVNLAQEFLAQRPPATIQMSSSSWLPWPEADGAQWRLFKEEQEMEFVRDMGFVHGFADAEDDEQAASAEAPQEDADGDVGSLEEDEGMEAGADRYSLQTKIDGTLMTWEWFGQ